MFSFFEKFLIIVISLLTCLIIAAYAMPFSFFVDVSSVKYHDVCLGDFTQKVTAQRSVWPPYGVPATAIGEVFKYEGETKLETIHKRNVFFTYQKENGLVTYEVAWSAPFTSTGEYGASDLIEIHPFPFIYKKAAFPEDNQRFSVVECIDATLANG